MIVLHRLATVPVIVWGRAWVVLWFALIAAMIADELYAVFGRNPARPTLTDVLSHTIPWWIVVPFTGWLFAHFVLAYFGRNGTA